MRKTGGSENRSPEARSPVKFFHHLFPVFRIGTPKFEFKLNSLYPIIIPLFHASDRRTQA